MRLEILFIFSAFFLALVGCQKSKDLTRLEDPLKPVKKSRVVLPAAYEEISAQRLSHNADKKPEMVDSPTLDNWLVSDSLIVIDLNSEITRAKYGTVPGAKAMTLKMISEKELKAHENKNIVFYGENSQDNNALQAYQRTREMGIAKTYILSGGIVAWDAYLSSKK